MESAVTVRAGSTDGAEGRAVYRGCTVTGAMADMGERDLIADCCAGNRAAQSRFFRAYRARVAALGSRLLGPAADEDLEDIVQHVFIALFQSLTRYRGDSSLDTWVYRVASNVCMSRLRRRYRVRMLRTIRPGDRALETVAYPVTADRGAVGSELRRQVYAALDRIDNDRRVVFVLAEMEERTLDEIAQIVGRPVGTVKSRLFRARRDLARILRPFLGDDHGE